MAFSTRGRGEINVTPLIDVLLVLLVIFLIAAPNLVAFEQLDTPQCSVDCAADNARPLIVRVQADLGVVIVDDGAEYPMQAGEMPTALRAHLRNTTHVVFIELEDGLLWEHVVATVDTIHGIAPDARVALQVAK